MFQNWGFLLTEIVVLLALAALLGLFIGWLIWGRRSNVSIDTSEADRLRASLAECKARGDEARAKLARLEAELIEARAAAASATKAAVAMPAAAISAPVIAPAAPVVVAPAAFMAVPEPAAAPTQTATKPKGLTEARGGVPDDLKLVKGIGPALEKLCHKLGYFHFDQIASWTDTEIAWVDDNLEGFKGRVTRDEWVVQARDLAKGLPPR
jgi:predicted flap endonuclease-1-like 5' DNA nuclease